METPPPPPPEPQPVALLGSLALGWYPPIVTEIPRKLEPLDKDPFIEGL